MCPLTYTQKTHMQTFVTLVFSIWGTRVNNLQTIMFLIIWNNMETQDTARDNE